VGHLKVGETVGESVSGTTRHMQHRAHCRRRLLASIVMANVVAVVAAMLSPAGRVVYNVARKDREGASQYGPERLTNCLRPAGRLLVILWPLDDIGAAPAAASMHNFALNYNGGGVLRIGLGNEVLDP